MQLTIRRKLGLVGAIGLVSATLLGAGGYVAVSRAGTAMHAILATQTALRNHLDADMMHDALRADVLAALLATSEAEERAATADVHEHADTFRTRIAATAALPLDRDLVDAVRALDPSLRRYVAAAETIVADAGRDRDAARAALPGFLTEFENLESAMAHVSDLVEAAAARTRADGEALLTQCLRAMLLGWLATIVLALVAVTLTSRSITRPINAMVAWMRDLAEGHGDLTRRLHTTSGDEVGELARWFNAFMDELHGVVAHVKTSACNVAAGSQRLASAVHHISSGTQTQAAALQSTTTDLAAMASTTQANAASAREASRLVKESCAVASDGAQIITASVEVMGEVSAAAGHIANIVASIDDLAFQTNLLALNAAVEAARAGEEGRGFSVVAAEVRLLAQRSADAAREIRALIARSVATVERGVRMVGESGTSLEQILASVDQVNRLVRRIEGASAAQADGMERVHGAMHRVEHGTQTNVGEVEQLAATAQTLAAEARALRGAVGRFRLDDTAR